jgi:alcohol dehydrogenase class IV
MDYRFFSPQEIRFGWGTRREAGSLAAKLGRRAWIVLGSRRLGDSEFFREILDSLKQAGVAAEVVGTISHEPEVADVDQITEKLLHRGAGDGDLILAIGGGSAIDLGKAVAAMVTNREGDSVCDYLEGVGKGFAVTTPPLPTLAMPTTSGTGAEVTKNAVISSYDPAFKKSLRSDSMIPKIVLVDPELTVTLPRDVTKYSGMDALTQCIESYISRRATPFSRMLAKAGADAAIFSLEMAVNVPDSREAREKMAHAAMLSGFALANSGLGIAHGVAAALGVHCRVPHGLACAVMLPVAIEVNRRTSQQQLLELVQGWGFPDTDPVGNMMAYIDELSENLGIPRQLSQLGVTREQLPAIVKSSYGNSMSGNPRDISEEELSGILGRML